MYESLLDKAHPWIPNSVIYDIEEQTLEQLNTRGSKLDRETMEYMKLTCMIIMQLTNDYDVRVFRPLPFGDAAKLRTMRLSTIAPIIRAMDAEKWFNNNVMIVNEDIVSYVSKLSFTPDNPDVTDILELVRWYPIIVTRRSGYEV